jgi:hypothetical protein
MAPKCGPRVSWHDTARPCATGDEVAAAWRDPKLVNVLCHDWEADSYQEKWSTSSAAMLGWSVRTFEAAVPPERLGPRWSMFAYRSWQRLYCLDGTVLARVVPRTWFYNALVTGTRP